ncbi:MAG: hypothetical protein ABR907_03135 [Terracidiphilus sp.]|jgi:hypothetical protein
MNRKVQSDFLFAEPTFASVAARLLGLWGQFDDDNDGESPHEADAKAIAADWLVVGRDIKDAIEQNESACGVA